MELLAGRSSAGGDLGDRVECVWWQVGQSTTALVLPDACLDLIWLEGRELVVAGADRGPRAVTTTPGLLTCGIRFRPGAAGSSLAVPASELLDQQVPAEALWPESAPSLVEALDTAGPDRQLALLRRFVAERPAPVDELVSRAARAMAGSTRSVAAIAEDLGVTERTLHRRTTAAVGYGPKMLARVMRLRRLPAISELSLAELAHAAGYASQAHMGDDVRALTGMSPVRFLEYAGGSSVLA